MKMAKQKIKITNEFIDQDSNMQIRGSKSDFETIEYRHINVVQNMPGFMNNSGLIDIIGKAMSHYNSGWYSQALNYLLKALDITPNLSPYLFYYKKICETINDWVLYSKQ